MMLALLLALHNPPCWRFVRKVPEWTNPLYCIPDSLHAKAVQYAPITALVNGRRTYKMKPGDSLRLYAHHHGKPVTSVTVDHVR